MNHKYKNTAYAPKELSRDFNIFFSFQQGSYAKNLLVMESQMNVTYV